MPLAKTAAGHRNAKYGQIAQLYQNALKGSREFVLRLMEIVTILCHDIALYIKYEGGALAFWGCYPVQSRGVWNRGIYYFLPLARFPAQCSSVQRRIYTFSRELAGIPTFRGSDSAICQLHTIRPVAGPGYVSRAAFQS
jgi:hypothetical protein